MPESGFLWASGRSRAMNGAVINNAVRERTRKALGFPINLHRFRRAAATLWSVQDPVNVRGVKDRSVQAPAAPGRLSAHHRG
jgi:hypothetical protein